MHVAQVIAKLRSKWQLIPMNNKNRLQRSSMAPKTTYIYKVCDNEMVKKRVKSNSWKIYESGKMETPLTDVMN